MLEAFFLLAVTALCVIGVIVFTLEELRQEILKDKEEDK